MDTNQYGRWASGNGYGGGVRTGTYEQYCNDNHKWGAFEPYEREMPVEKDANEKKVKDLTIDELKELLNERKKRER